MAMYLLRKHDEEGKAVPSRNPLVRFQRWFERRFEAAREGYGAVLGSALAGGGWFIGGFLLVAVASLALVPFLGRNFFPEVDSGNIALHVRGPVGMRLEETSALFARVEAELRRQIPAKELDTIVDNIGLPTSSINTTYNASGTVGPQDGDILIGLKPDHTPTARTVEALRRSLPKLFPTATFSFLPADITSQILNFGAPAPVDIQVTGKDVAASEGYAQKILRAISTIPGLADARIEQPASYPEFRFDVDRTRITELALNENDVTGSVATAIAGTSQTAPIFWLNPQNGVTYPVVAQMPEYRVDSLDKLFNIPVNGAPGQPVQVLGGLGTLTRDSTDAVLSQYNIQPTVDVYATPAGRDLGAVSADVQRALHRLGAPPKTISVIVRGQYTTMQTAFSGLGWGLLGAIVLIYLLVVVNFQSWLDPFIIISALPAALAALHGCCSPPAPRYRCRR